MTIATALRQLDFEASDVTLATRYVPAAHGVPELYRIEAGATDLNLSRDVPRNKTLRVHGILQAALDLEPSRLSLRSLKLTAHSSGAPEHALAVTGVLDDFNHPRWQAKVVGDLDMQLLEPLTGYPDAAVGIAHLDLVAGGLADEFHIDGGVHVDGGSYVIPGVVVTGINLDAQVHADPRQLLITQIVARIRQGGQIEGTVALQPWLPGPSAPRRPASVTAEGDMSARNVLVPIPPVSIPVNGKVTANFHDVSLDAVLDMVSVPPFRRLGIASLLNGPAVATWSKGDDRTVSVTAAFALSPFARGPEGEAPASGAIDATYTQRNGAVDLRNLDLHLPNSEVQAHGTIGAYPLTSSSALNVDFHSRNLGEFDRVLRDLGLERNGRTGAAALPIALAGQADFQGSWTGSLVRPHLTGSIKATQFALEMPSADGSAAQPRFVHMDSIEAAGSYSPAQIAVEHAQLLRGKTRVLLDGTLDASPGPEPAFDADSVLHAHIQGESVEVSDVQPFLATKSGGSLPVAGAFNTRIQLDGPLHEPTGSGSIEMDGGILYGEPFDHLRIQAAVAGQDLKLLSGTLVGAAGNITAAGNYDFNARSFTVDAHGTGIDISRVHWVQQHNLDVAGKLAVSITGSGSFDDPHLQADATVNSLILGGQRFGAFEVAAHTANHSLAYNVTTQLQGAELALKGNTALSTDYATHAQLDFSRFNIGALFRMAHISAVSGESALAGTVTIDGPLAHPQQLRGEAQIRQLALTVAGVRLQSEGDAHATLANGRVHLDPFHVTGEDTDLRAARHPGDRGSATTGSCRQRLRRP